MADLDILPGGSAAAMGVTALLDELLAEGAGTGGRELPPSPDPEHEIAYTRAGAAQDGINGCRQAINEVSPRSRQIAELCGEMDSCLASLSKWEEDSRCRVEALRKGLEAEYGFGFEDKVRFPAWELRDIDSEDAPDEPLERSAPGLLDQEELVGEAYCRALALGTSSPEPRTEDLRREASTDPLRRADEERIAKLRAEVENLRQKEAEMQQEIFQQWLDAEALEGSGSAAAAAAAMPVGANSSNISFLCREADQILGETGGGDSPARAKLAAEDEEECAEMEEIEARLAAVQDGITHMEGNLDSARSMVDSELSELEKLLADRSL